MQEGLVYAVEFSHRSGRDLINVAKKRTNIIPIIEDARHPHKYRMLVGESGFPSTCSGITATLPDQEWWTWCLLMWPSQIKPGL